jgi:pyrroloquinoline quinone biosynthesis protein B
MLRIVVLGAAAGGGFPQWNSNQPGCRRVRAGDPAAKFRNQASIAVSADGERWLIVNASPDMRAQIEYNSILHPKHGLRSSPISAVMLTGADIDTITGLLTLREREPYVIYATENIHGVLDANPIFEVLARDVVQRKRLTRDEPVALKDAAGHALGLTVELFGVPGKIPLYLEQGAADPAAQLIGDGTVGVEISDGAGDSFFFIPGCARMTPELATRLTGAKLVFFDGTLYRDDEMVQAGVGQKTGQRMGHMSLSGPGGTIESFASLGVKRKILIHINNTNPVLLDDSPEHAAVSAAGWEVSYDGMEIAL